MRFLARSILLSTAAIGLLSTGANATVLMTGETGGNQPFSNYQPSLVVNQLVATNGIFPSRGGGSATQTLGKVRSFGGNFGAYGAPLAQGQGLDIAQNQALFSIFGTQFGGDGRVTFGLPDLAGKVAIGSGQGPGLANFNVGQQHGLADVVLTSANLPSHNHGLPGGGVTTSVGNGQAFTNYQPSLAMTYMISTTGFFPSRSGGAPRTFLGEIALFGGNFAPSGWTVADGRLLNIADNSALFSIIGTTYGGDGRSTFALPDLRGRAIVGAGQGPGLDNVSLGEKLGSPETTLAEEQMPAHSHSLPGGGDTDNTGGTTIIDTTQPGLGLNYLVALNGLFPSRDGGGDLPFDEPFLGEIFAFAGNFAPRGYAFAQGQLLDISQHQALFAILGTTYGGDGRQTFALPDLRGRMLLGSGDGFSLGDRFGSETTLLTVANLPSHSHEFRQAPGVPEPTTWAMLIAGFGLVGSALRRRRKLNIKLTYA